MCLVLALTRTPPIIYAASLFLDFADRSVVFSLSMKNYIHVVNVLLHPVSDPVPLDGSNVWLNLLTIRGLSECG